MRDDTANAEEKPFALKWNLADLYSGPEDPSLGADVGTSLRRARDFQAAYQGSRSDPPSAEFLRRLQEYESILEQGLKPFLFASLLFELLPHVFDRLNRAARFGQDFPVRLHGEIVAVSANAPL